MTPQQCPATCSAFVDLNGFATDHCDFQVEAAKMTALVRVIVVSLLACIWATGTLAASTDKPAEAAAAKPTQPLTPEAVREMVSRLSDEDVRKLLIEQLDRGSARPAAKDDAGMAMMGTMAVMWRTRAAEIGAAALALPATTASVLAKLGAGTTLSLVLFVLAAMLAAGALAEFVWRHATRGWRERHSDVRGAGFFEDAFRRGTGFLVDFMGLVAFAAGALATFFAMWQGYEHRRNLALGLLSALLLTRAVVLIARFLLAPSRPESRLLPLPDATARALTWFAGTVAALYSFGIVVAQSYVAGGADAATVDALGLAIATTVLIVTLFTIWNVRGAIAALIRGSSGGGNLVRLFADLWPVAAIAYVIAVCAGRVREVVTGEKGVTGGGILSLLILVALPVVDYALCRALAAAAAGSKRVGAGSEPGFVASYEPVLRRVIHIVVIVAGLLWLADLWNLNLFAMAQQSLGGRVASSLLGISLVLLLAYMLWEIARTAIDRRLAAEQVQPVDSPSSRLRTLLPLLRVTLLITIAVMATLSVLAALGVDILPLLAGAGVVGVAIGFGSQTLVRDIVSGAFFLMDDAFRLGEYIEVGQAKGRIEKIAVRALFLRHHRGAINVLPYGEIKQLRNTSRDWMIMVMEFRLAFDTDLKKVKKILKQIGEEIAADPELGPEMLQRLKSQGVNTTDDSALVVRAKYMARPGNAPFMIRRVAYEKILKAFAEQGIEFASRRVAIYVPPGADEDDRKRAGAAAAIAAQESTAGPKAAD
jgi:small-conductance mechanosensitive channel